MSSKTNIGLIASGEIFGFPAEAAVARIDGKTFVSGEILLGNRDVGDLVEKTVDSGLTKQLTSFLPSGKNKFSALFASRDSDVAFLLNGNGIVAGIAVGSGARFIVSLDTPKLKEGSDFEKKVADIATWACIDKLTLIAQTASAGGSNSLLKNLISEELFLTAPDSYSNYNLVVGGSFDLAKSDFGKTLQVLTGDGTKNLDFWVGGGSAGFAASFVCAKIKNSGLEIDDFKLDIEYRNGYPLFSVGGSLKIKMSDNSELGFGLKGLASPQSFQFSAYSLPNTRIYLNNTLFFSDLSLSIGVVTIPKPGMVFGMSARLTSDNLSVFAGFAISFPPPNINLFTAAITSKKENGRTSLKDIIKEIAEVDSPALNALDCIAVEDFDLQNAKVKSPTDTRNVKEWADEANKVLDESMQIGDAEITPMDNDYILTDKGTMRHYHIGSSGALSLNCQIFVCTAPTTLGIYSISPGFFICGVLDLFKLKIRFLFAVEKGESVTALLQIAPIELKVGNFTVFSIGASGKTLTEKPIDGGLAGQLVKPGTGATLFLRATKNTLDFYLNAKVNFLCGLFGMDALVVIRDKMVHIDVDFLLFGFKVIIKLATNYNDFSSSKFEFQLIFDASGFLEAVKKACQAIRDTARKVGQAIDSAKRSLTTAQNNVLTLQNQINDFNKRIDDCRAAIRSSRWYRVCFRIGKGLEIVGYEIAKAGIYVSMGIAIGVLEVAKAALSVGGAIAQGVLQATAFILEAATQILAIKRFEISATFNSEKKEFAANLDLIVLGKDVSIGRKIDLKDKKSIDDFVGGSIDDQAAKTSKDLEENKITKSSDTEDFIDLESLTAYSKCKDLGTARQRYDYALALEENTSNMLQELNLAHFQAYGEEYSGWREHAAELVRLNRDNEVNDMQMAMAFDEEFSKNLDTVLENIPSSRAPEMSKIVSDLVSATRIYAQSKASKIMRGEIERPKNLMEQMEADIEKAKQAKRAQPEPQSDDPEQANREMADSLVKLLTKYNPEEQTAKKFPNDFTNLLGENEEVADIIASSIFALRNPDQREDDIDDDGDSDDEET
ncbi:hypothetical protein AGMMS49938_00750 [Fibrobacterales bacterium]|nr:hypothetical protein AGMMS49938_00750 [Fibrobacterales bacterium]